MARRAKLLTPLPVLGLDKSKPGQFIAARATTNAKNARVRRSIIEKRGGTAAIGLTLGERVQEIFEFNDGSVYHLCRWGPTKFQEFDRASKVWQNKANAPLTGGVDDQISVATPLLSGSRILAYTNGLDAIRKYTGSGNDANLGGSPPIAKYVIDFGPYLVLLNVTDGGNHYGWRVQWPDTGDCETWSGGNANSQDLLEDSGDITGGGKFGQYITVHKEDSIYIGYLTQDTTVFHFERRATGAGTIAHRSIKTLPTGEQIFLARDGLRLFQGTSAPLIESPIADEIREFLNPQYAYKSFADLRRELDEVWIAMPIGNDTEPATVYKFNYVTRQLHVDYRTNMTACGLYTNTVGQITWDDLSHTWDAWVGPWDNIQLASLNPITAFGDSSGVTTKEDTGSSDNGTAIDLEWDSKDFGSDDYGLEPNLMMEWQGIHLWLKGSGSASIYYSVDEGQSWTLIDTIALNSDYPDDMDPQVVYFDSLSTKCRMRLKHNTNNQTVAMKQFAMIAVPREETDY
jgi:hypothetical protein